jgi:S1-C subfamily serine protease
VRALAAVLGACATMAAPARAQFMEERVGVWSVSGYLKDGTFSHCAMSTRNANASKVLLFFIGQQLFQLGVSDRSWSYAVGTRVDAYYRIDGGAQVAVSAQAVRPHILNVTLPAQKMVLEQFRTASTLRVGVRGGTEMTIDFALPNSAAAFDRLYACGVQGMRMLAERGSAPTQTQSGQMPGHNTPTARPPAPRSNERASAPPQSPQPRTPTATPAKPPERAAAPGDSADPKRIASATGFYITRAGHILTAAHVIKECKTVRAQLIGEAPAAAVVIAKSEADDLALLKTERGPETVAPIRIGSLRLGEQIVQFGFPLATSLASSGNLTTGNIAALAGLRDDHRMIQISAPSQPGNSGGPVLDLQGRVVGVLVGGFGMRYARSTGTLPQNINFAVKSSVTMSFLEAQGVSIEPGTAGQDMSVADVAERARKFTARIDCFE